MMSRPLRYAVLVPLSALAFYVLFVLQDVDLGWPGGLAVLVGAWLVWYLLWATLQQSAAATDPEGGVAAASPGERRAWIGLAFTTAIVIYYALRSSQMVAVDGSMAPAASAIGKHIGMLVVGWLVVMQLLRSQQADAVQSDERDRQIEARACGWARAGLSVFVIALAVTFAFSPLDRLAWAQPMAISNLLVIGLMASCMLEYLAIGVAYWRDRRDA